MEFDYALGQRKPDTGTLDLQIQSLEQVENALQVIGIDTDTIVAYLTQYPVINPVSADLDQRDRLGTRKLDGVTNQVLINLENSSRVTFDSRHIRIDRDFDGALSDLPCQH